MVRCSTSDHQPENILVNESAVLVDWTAPGFGPAVVNLTELATQLIASGAHAGGC